MIFLIANSPQCSQDLLTRWRNTTSRMFWSGRGSDLNSSKRSQSNTIIEEAVEPTVTRHQVKQAARRMSTKKSMDSSDNLPVVVEEKDVDQNDTKEGYDNAAFEHETEDRKEEDKVLKDLDKVIDNVPLSSIE